MDEPIRYTRSRVSYCRRELQYGTKLCASLIDPGSGVDDHGRIAYNSMLQCISVLEKGLQILDAKALNIAEILEVEKALAVFPHALHNLLIFALQRKYHPIKYFSNKSFPSYSFSEIHPTYYSEIISLEKVNYSLFNKFNKLIKLDLDKSMVAYPPILCLSDRPRYALEFIYEPNTPPICLPDPEAALINPSCEPVEVQQILKSHLSLSYMHFPRTAPSHVRYSGAMGHEHMHRLLSLMAECLQFARNADTDKLPAEYSNQRAIDVFGEALVDFSTKYYVLYQAFYDILKEACLQNKVIEELNWDSDDLDSRIYLHFNEIICDIVGIHLCGKSAYYSYTNAFLNLCVEPENNILSLMTSRHPPRELRIFFMLEALQTCIDRDFSDDDDEIILKSKYDEHRKLFFERSNTPYYRAMLKWHDNYIDQLGEFISALRQYCPNDLKDDKSSYLEIIDKAKKGETDFSSYLPIQIINAIWYKTLFPPVLETYEVRWRLAIENCSVT